MQLYPDICGWKPKSKNVTLRKFSIFCLVMPGLMSLEITPSDVEATYNKAIKAAEDVANKLQMAAFEALCVADRAAAALATEAALAAQATSTRKQKAAAPSVAPVVRQPPRPIRKAMDSEVFVRFALPLVRVARHTVYAAAVTSTLWRLLLPCRLQLCSWRNCDTQC
jgi:hypothetical protein